MTRTSISGLTVILLAGFLAAIEAGDATPGRTPPPPASPAINETTDSNVLDAAALRACDAGEYAWCVTAARKYLIEDLPTSSRQPDDIRAVDPRAATLLERACKGEHAIGCSVLGYMYHSGQGVPWDLGRARELYQRGCDLGDSRGCAVLGQMYENGVGVTRDFSQAAEWFERACRSPFLNPSLAASSCDDVERLKAR